MSRWVSITFFKVGDAYDTDVAGVFKSDDAAHS